MNETTAPWLIISFPTKQADKSFVKFNNSENIIIFHCFENNEIKYGCPFNLWPTYINCIITLISVNYNRRNKSTTTIEVIKRNKSFWDLFNAQPDECKILIEYIKVWLLH